ncbi:hypothetical protein P22_0215 [Propionispora sp. 2/2-37]|uniref:NfeD family protein n=1 Tax=Propionispora sp. 2/2-37 TaxID=1677858 RepID=UPI0006BB5B1A|nr:NfeD family protein [Propionispora sp. 2/2-37]CUH94153.1 hypothetical protein P22_0215 [Propionispora sp. 2/2-37]
MRTVIAAVILCAVFIFSQSVCSAQERPAVLVISIKGEINEAQVALLNRALSETRDKQVDAVILEIDTFGGLVDSAVKLRDMIVEAAIHTKTIGYVKNRAWSAGALVTLAHQNIVMAEGGSIGAAEPIPATEKNISALKAEFAATAKKNGRNPRIAEAMVDKTTGIPGYTEAGQILSLADYQAVQLGYADVIASERGAVLAHYGLENSDVIEYNLNWKDNLAGWLGSSAGRALLLTILFLAILIELKTAGTGIAGIIAILAALLFFTGQWLLGLASWLEIMIFLVGVILITGELFFLGTGILAAAGVSCIFASLFLALGADTQAVQAILFSLATALVLFFFLAKQLSTSSLWKKLMLKETETSQEGFVSGPDYTIYQGKIGITVTKLRPAGVVEIEGVWVDVISEGVFVDEGVKVKVTGTDSNRVVVRPIAD